MLLTCVPTPVLVSERLFLSDLENKLRPIGLKGRENLLALKKEEHAEKGYLFDSEFYVWDYRYYDHTFIERTPDLDDALVKEYFPYHGYCLRYPRYLSASSQREVHPIGNRGLASR